MPPPPPPPPSNVPPPVAYKPPEVSTSSAGRGDLLDSIRKGNKLKKVPESEKKEKSGDLVGKVVDRNAPKKSSSESSTPPKPANTGFVSTGNPMMDEILKKRQGLGNNSGGSSTTANTPPVRATPPTVPSNRPPSSSSTVPSRTAPTLPSRTGASQSTTSTPPPVVSTPSVPTRTTPSVPTRTTPTVPPTSSVTTSSNPPSGDTGRRAPPPLPQKTGGDTTGRRVPPPLPQKTGGTSQPPSLPSRNPPQTTSTPPPVVSTPPPVVEKKPPPPPRNEVKAETSSPTLPVRKQPPVSNPPVVDSPNEASNIQTEGRFQFRTDLPPVPAFTGKPKNYKTKGSSSTPSQPSSNVPPPRPTKPKRDIEKEKKELEAQANGLMQDFVKKMMFEKCVPLRDLLEKIGKATDEATLDNIKEQLSNM